MSLRASGKTDVLLVSMPWTVMRAPSIQLGLLKAVLDGHGLQTRTAHLYVDFFDRVATELRGRRLSVDRLESFGEFFGEWTFSVPPFCEPSPDRDSAFRSLMIEQHGEWVDLAFRVRDLVPKYLEVCAEAILGLESRTVGFSTTFHQNVPSLVLARMLKRSRPDLRIVFGGANCEGPMGEALLRCFPWIDVVVRGEGERIAPRLFAELLDDRPLSRQPGLCMRQAGEVVVCEDTVIDDREVRPVRITPLTGYDPTREARRSEELGAGGPVPMDSLPLPVYDDYFERLMRSPLAQEDSHIWLPYESARGCWWAIKKVCTFCAANAQYLSFRSRRPDKVRADVLELSRRYGSRRVWFVDNIMEERYLRELFPQMSETPVPMFVETRAHVSKDQLRAMRDAGVMMVQLGLESLSTPILRLIDKGTTAIQNIRVIKWCAELGIRAFYNIIYGFPGEPPEEYERMADAVLSLTHLEAPNPPVRLRLDRFSPYHRDPKRFGIEILGPYPSRRFVFDLPQEELEQIEYFFAFRYKDGRNPDAYAAPLLHSCRVWRESWRRDFRSLHFHRVPTGLRICDSRGTTGCSVFDLAEAEARVYLGCDAGSTPRGAWEFLTDAERQLFNVADVEEFLRSLVRFRLTFVEGDRYLSLAVEVNEIRDRHAAGEAQALRLRRQTAKATRTA